MRNRMGFSSQAATSNRLRISSSTLVIVPKKRKPCSLMTIVCRPIDWMKARCACGRRTVDFACEPLKMARMGLRREFWMTKKSEARITPRTRPSTKSKLSKIVSREWLAN